MPDFSSFERLIREEKPFRISGHATLFGVQSPARIPYSPMPLRFESPSLLFAALGLALAAVCIAIIRRPDVPRLTQAMIAVGLLLLSLAAGGAQWRRARGGEVLVMLDLSPSTRIADYRDRAALDRRLQQLLGDTPRRLLLFAEDQRPDRGDGALADMRADHTVFAPPPADAILLFSDARFDLPATAPRTFIAIDPALEQPTDAAVNRLQVRGGNLVADVNVSGTARDLVFQGTAATQPVHVDPGAVSIARPMISPSASAQFTPGDPWPENDGLWITAQPPETHEKWWVGPSPPPGWRALEPAALPLSSAAYLAPAVIVLNDVPAAALAASQSRLQQYVRDLGGALVILGGDHAFAAGDYGGSSLESMSPLASYPPKPAMQWIILVDGSGSMGEATSDGTRWQTATSAIKQLLPHLPPEDLATIGGFAEDVTWWSAGRSVRETMAMPIPPADLTPRGPTNLQRAMLDVACSATGELPRQLIVVSDADARIDESAKIASELKSKRISLSVLAIGNGSGLDALKQIAAATGGSVASVMEAKSWAGGLLDLSRAAMPERVEQSPLPARFLSPLTLSPREVAPWNHSWLKSSATALAEAKAGSEIVHPVAEWRLGAGEVVAAAFVATAKEAEALADLFARPPRDPRFRVTWDAGSKLRVTVDAVDGKTFLNDQDLVLELRSADGSESAKAQAIPQSGPGKYELSVPSPRMPAFASARAGGRLLDQIAVAGHYAPEFDAIGNDHDAMHELARRTGGEVIDLRRTKPIDFHWPRRDVPLVSWLAAAGAVFVALGLVRWRMP